ncbi:magnetosome protein MamA [Solidesulfovibrio magneticus]|uniref:magnetosome protein MamA n=1 Tax=Solidesulfovibrio magneticus TaxID=184917 RepID=UPI000319C4C8|nr:magnetosome protein MamA [Solidesulfovibrio magneticus]
MGKGEKTVAQPQLEDIEDIVPDDDELSASEGAPVGRKKAAKAKKNVANMESSVEDSSTFYWNSLLLLSGRLLNRTLDWYNGLFSLTPRDKAKLYRNISQRCLRRGSPEEALRYLKEWARHEKNDPEPLYQMGIALANLGDYQRAVTVFDKVLKLRPNHFMASYRKGAVLLKMKQYKLALPVLEAVVAEKPEDARAYYLLGLAYDGDEQLEKGIEAMQKAVDLDPEEIKYHQHLGFMNVRKDDHKTAAEHFTKVMELERSQDSDEE